ncbi:MAG: hypothetical protein JNM72_19070 [Deltaproteobacteria bacterium]|nr:hypothetical protein [Deltaproteobacteria bacterium]
MSFMSVRQLQPQTLTANYLQRDEDVTDFGACNTLICDCRVLKAAPGSTGKVELEHSASGEPGSYLAVANVGWLVTGATSRIAVVTDFLRFVRVVTDSNVSGDPVVVVDIVGKA